jgi:hypothetical protein
VVDRFVRHKLLSKLDMGRNEVQDNARMFNELNSIGKFLHSLEKKRNSPMLAMKRFALASWDSTKLNRAFMPSVRTQTALQTAPP